MRGNKVKRNCRFYDKPEICEQIQTECNCYQCDIALLEIEKSRNKHLELNVHKLEEENRLLKQQISVEGLKKVLEEQTKPVYDTSPIEHERKQRRKNKYERVTNTVQKDIRT